MPIHLDRPCNITIPATGSRNQYGEYVQGAPTTRRVWCRLDRDSLKWQLEESGSRSLGRVRAIVRYRNEFIRAQSFTGWELNLDGAVYSIIGIDETANQPRRRYLTISAVRRTD